MIPSSYARHFQVTMLTFQFYLNCSTIKCTFGILKIQLHIQSRSNPTFNINYTTHPNEKLLNEISRFPDGEIHKCNFSETRNWYHNGI